MSRTIIAAAVGAFCLGPVAAQADIIDGSFIGTMSAGTDTTGVFGSPGADLTGDAVTGSFVYDTGLFSQSVSGSQNTAAGTGLGALTVTLTINGDSHIFTDNTSSGIFLDDSASEITLQNANTSSGVSENFYLDASDFFTPFINSTDLNQTFSTSDAFLSSSGTFSINDVNPNVAAGGAFTITSLSGAPVATAVPEPASAALLAFGLAGLGWMRRRQVPTRTGSAG